MKGNIMNNNIATTSTEIAEAAIEAAFAAHKPGWAVSGGWGSNDAQGRPVAAWESRKITNKPDEPEFEIAAYREDLLVDGQVVDGEAEICVWVGPADAVRFKTSESIAQATKALNEANWLMQDVDGTFAKREAFMTRMEAEQAAARAVECGIEGCDKTFHERQDAPQEWNHQIPQDSFPDFANVAAVAWRDGHRSGSVFLEFERDDLTHADVLELADQLAAASSQLRIFAEELA